MNTKQREQIAEKWLDEVLRSYADAEPRPGLESRVVARLAAEERAQHVRWLLSRFLRPSPSLAVATIAAVLLLAAGLELGNSSRRSVAVSRQPSETSHQPSGVSLQPENSSRQMTETPRRSLVVNHKPNKTGSQARYTSQQPVVASAQRRAVQSAAQQGLEVLVPPDEQKAFAEFVACVARRDAIAQAVVMPAANRTVDRITELPQVSSVDIADLQLGRARQEEWIDQTSISE
ncbi:MAG: hypothetical protein ABSD20_02370 [Terriglobales bacterium]|jgi:hypothetical protein